MSQLQLTSKVDISINVRASGTSMCGDDCRFRQEACLLFMSKLKVVSFKNGLFERCSECISAFQNNK